MIEKYVDNIHLLGRFVSDYSLPIPIIYNKEYFKYYINLFDSYYGTVEKWNSLIQVIDEKFDSNPEMFLQQYKSVREEIITTVSQSTAYQEFNTMDMGRFALKDKPNVSSNNIYNCDNIGKTFVSYDLRKANFQALKWINEEIVLKSKTYEDFIRKFTDLQYIADSKYTRQVIFGTLNPSRHITVEKYLINRIREQIDLINSANHVGDKLVSLTNDEVVYERSDKYNKEVIDQKLLGFEVKSEVFKLCGMKLMSDRKHDTKMFYYKVYENSDIKPKLISIPKPLFPLVFDLFFNNTTNDTDYMIEHDGYEAKLVGNFKLEFYGEK